MRDQFLIQKARQSDIDEINQIYEESIDWLNNKGIFQWKRGVYPTRQTALDAFLEDCLYCCYHKGKIVGTFILNEKQPPPYEALAWKYRDGNILVLHTLVVKPDETGKGVARAMINNILRIAKENTYAIRLDAFPDNKAAVSLYHSFGFEYVGKVFFDIKEPGYKWYDCYEKLLDKGHITVACPDNLRYDRK